MAMEAYQWFLLGMMVAWTPGLLALAFMLWRRHIDRNSARTRSRTSVPLHDRPLPKSSPVIYPPPNRTG